MVIPLCLSRSMKSIVAPTLSLPRTWSDKHSYICLSLVSYSYLPTATAILSGRILLPMGLIQEEKTVINSQGTV